MSFLSRKHSTPAGRTGLSASGPNSTSRTRLAAVVALVAVIAWLAVVASTVVFEFGDFLLALGSVFGLVFFGWFVLTRRGLVRLLGVPGALLGLAGLINFVGVHWSTLLVLIGVVALFGATGRYAVRDDRTVHRVQQSVRPPGRRRVTGGGRDRRDAERRSARLCPRGDA